ncbi:MAG: rhodanese-like domain-containing protein [Kiritimatiellaceae bacterium]|nr:rhodanese-like domain-containing protein [Kiritimatiellaceae bacterium]
MNRKFVWSAALAAGVLGGITIAEACSGCGCTIPKKAESGCASEACAVTDAAKESDRGHSHHKNLTYDQMKEAVDSGKYILLDARGDKYFNGELIPGARRLVAGTADAEILKALPNKDADIITYCSNTKCPASKKLAGQLVALGYTHVQEYPEGLAGWKAGGGITKSVK